MSFDLPPATRALLIANVAVYLLELLVGYPTFIAYFALWPLGPHQPAMLNGHVVMVGFQIWQLVTYAFLHGGLMHIAFNMFALFMFGGVIERTFGKRNYLLYYFVCLLVAGICQLIVLHLMGGRMVPTLGASGAIFGLLLAFGMMYPHERIMLIIPPIPMPAWVFVMGYGAIELFLGVTGTEAGVAHFAHLGGMLGGFALIQYWRGKLPIKPKHRLMR